MRSAWATTCSSATATACARRCSGARIATPASRAPIRSGCICRRSWIRSTAIQSTNVEAQMRDPSSLLSWTKRMLAVRKTSQAFGRGSRRFLRPGNRKILAYLREYGEDTILCVANLSRSAQPVELNLSRVQGPGAGRDARAHHVPADRRPAVSADPLGLRLLLVQADDRRRGARPGTSRSVSIDERPGAGAVRRLEQPVPRSGGAVAHRHGREDPAAVRNRHAAALHRDAALVCGQGRADRARAHRRSRAVAGRQDRAGWSRCSRSAAGTEAASYFMPLALAWEERDEERVRNLSTAADRQGPPAGECRRHGRCLCGRSFLPRARRGHGGAARDRDRAGQAAIPADRGVRAGWREPISTLSRSPARKGRAPIPWS